MATTETVSRALEELRTAFPGVSMDIQDDDQGGSWVVIEKVELGDLYEQQTSWIGFRITFQYPYADVYPHFVRADLTRKDARPLGDGITGGHTFLGRSALQLSRRSNRLNPATDTALLKLMKVLKWLSTHP
jgi:hypothetical protein